MTNSETLPHTSEQIQADVQNAIKWEPLLNAAEIGVAVNDGVVTLSGSVDSYAKKLEAENATKAVRGVKAIVEGIKIIFNDKYGKKTDNDIAKEVLNAFVWHRDITNDTIQVKVEDGWVTLEGEQQWNYQREAAGVAIRNLTGIRGISNKITINPQPADDIEQHDIANALHRNRFIDDKNIVVQVNGKKVTLTGSVTSWYDRDEAARIAWNAPGVASLANELAVL